MSGDRQRWNVRLAATLAGGCAVLAIATVIFTYENGGLVQGLGEMLALMTGFYAYFVVGLLLLVRRPGNRLGWAMTAIGTLTAVGSFSAEYARYAYAPPGHEIPGAIVAAWINAWWWYPTIAMVFLFVPLLFPDGRALSPRWEWLNRFSVALVLFITIPAGLAPELAGDFYSVPNPIGVGGIGDIEEGAFGTVVFGTLIACMLAALVSVVVRFRRSTGVERQQMKWFVAAAAAMILLVFVEEMAATLGLDHLLPSSNVFFGLVVCLMPVSVGIAVLRYRLYDIDRIISRSLTYGVLTALLIAVYLAAVTSLTALTAPVTRESPVAVAAATLLAAAAFGPLRQRVQGVVDRRFNRARYDAARTVDGYRGRIRDEVDLATLTRGLLTAVEESVQPTSTALWLRNTGTTEGQTP